MYGLKVFMLRRSYPYLLSFLIISNSTDCMTPKRYEQGRFFALGIACCVGIYLLFKLNQWSKTVVISSSGDGNLNYDRIDTPYVKITSSGSGNIHINEIKAQVLTMLVHGSGDIEVGKITVPGYVTIKLNGSGNCKVLSGVAGTVTVTRNGSGNLVLANSTTNLF
jgi:hypothetical protein